LATSAAWGEEPPPGGAERLLTAADLQGAPKGELLAAGQPEGLPGAPRVSVSDLPPAERVPVLYFALSASEPLGAQVHRAVKEIDGCGPRKDLVLTVRRCVGRTATGEESDANARKRADSVARALRGKGFRTEVKGSDLSSYCPVLPTTHRNRLRPVEVTVERAR
jgi:hypothetical protein